MCPTSFNLQKSGGISVRKMLVKNSRLLQLTRGPSLSKNLVKFNRNSKKTALEFRKFSIDGNEDIPVLRGKDIGLNSSFMEK